MLLTRCESIALVATTSAALGACAATQDTALERRIARIETGMLPAVVVQGEETTPKTIHEIMRHFNVPGVSVAVIRDGVLEWAKGYGVLEASGAAVNTETLFLAGHMSQALATVGALSMVADGRLSLDANVNDWLSSWHVPDNEHTTSEKVTLRRLLSHTSGLNVSTLLGYLPGDPTPKTLQILDGAAPATNDPIRVTREPGSRQQYSLGGYVVLQQMLVDIAGMPYAAFMDSVILRPLGMGRSFHSQPLSGQLASNAATGHGPTNEPLPGRWRVYPELAALGMWTTPTDLAKLIIELQRVYAGETSRVIPKSLVEEMLSQQSENRGLGVEFGGEGVWQHFRLEGHGNNYLAEFYAYVSRGMAAVVMTNSSNGEGVKAHVLRAIAVEYGWPDLLPEQVETVRLSEEALRELEGTYSFRGRDRVLRVVDGRIIQSTEGGAAQELRALSDSLLVSLTFGYRYAVDRDQSGTITGLTLILDGTRLFTYERN